MNMAKTCTDIRPAVVKELAMQRYYIICLLVNVACADGFWASGGELLLRNCGAQV